MYSAQTSEWALGFSAFALLPLLIGVVLLLGAALPSKRAVPRTTSRTTPIAIGAVFLAAGFLAVSESIALTHKCTSERSLESARTVEGTVGPVEPIGKFGSQYYRFTVGVEPFVSGAPGVKSECGFKSSLAQSMYPPVGKHVRVRAVGSTVVELHILR